MENKKVSCPSKVLVVGGYSILFEGNKGLILSTSACYEATIITHNTDIGSNKKEITVNSLGFSRKWKYVIDDSFQSELKLISQSNQPFNPFIEAALKVVLAYFNEDIPLEYNLEITIENDPAFYTIEKEGDKETLKKTGLGSSACVITSILTAAFLFFSQRKLEESKSLIHILAQTANSIAQNKIGSGFDISAAIFGNQIYSRFSPKLIEEGTNALKNFNPKLFREKIDLSLTEGSFEWSKAQKLNFPKCLKLWLLDLECGTDTRSFVKEVLKTLDENQELKQRFFEVSNNAATEFLQTLQEISELEKNSENINQIKEQLETLKNISKKYRTVMRELGEKSNVEIEPKILTELLDKLNSLEDVCYSICPGAGGYDAACIITTEMTTELILSKILEEILLTSELKDKLKVKILPISANPSAELKYV